MILEHREKQYSIKQGSPVNARLIDPNLAFAIMKLGHDLYSGAEVRAMVKPIYGMGAVVQ